MKGNIKIVGMRHAKTIRNSLISIILSAASKLFRIFV
jgi:hypothetical protein